MSKKQTIPKYNFKSIEKKWQKQWEEKRIYQPDIERSKKPFYNLMMFPYPSAEGLHVGNMYAFTGADVYGRFKKLEGYDVFEPIGLDGFGIHAENYAMRIGEHIKDVSKRSEKNFYRQLHEIGNMYDWSRTVETYKPEYYKWTQWIFLQMYQKGLAYQKEAKVNWCPSCKTVLSDEQVIAGECERCDSLVEKKVLKQWFFKITAYADKLLKNLDWIDWPEDVKTNQRNWIGRSEGALIKFPIISPLLKGDREGFNPNGQTENPPTPPLKNGGMEIECFTTRPDTLFGATYMVVSPEHEIIKNYKLQITNWNEVEKYISKSLKKTEQQRRNDEKTKTGIELKGIKAINPATRKEIPIWAADYVLGGYGTGAIMAVPAHDERDFEFAQKYNLEIKEVVSQEYGKPGKNEKWVDGSIVVVFDPKSQKYACLKWKAGFYVLVCGGIKKGEDYKKTATRELREEMGLFDFKKVLPLGELYSHYYNLSKKENKFASTKGFLVILNSKKKKSLKLEDHEKFKTVWLTANEMMSKFKKTIPEADHIREILSRGVQRTVEEGYDKTSKLNKNKKEAFVGEGRNINSGFLDGMETEEAKEEMVKWLVKTRNGEKSVDYKLRDWCISRQRYWGPPIPIIWCKNCALKNPPSLPLKKGGNRNIPLFQRGKEGVFQKVKVLMIHGFEGNGDGNWFPWMKKELEKIGCEVFAPTMKDNMHPSVSSWIKDLKPYSDKLDENSIVIGHSLGSSAALHLLGKTNKKIDKLFLIASAIGNPRRDWIKLKKDWPDSDVGSLKKFWKEKIDWKSANESVNKSYVVLSKDDRWIDPEHYKIAKLDNVIIEKWNGHKHFTQKKSIELRNYITEKILEDIEPMAVAVPEKDLPVKLPPMKDFLPEGKGKGPLAKNEKFVQTKCPVCDGKAQRETDVSDPFLDSAWYFFRYPSTEFNDKVFDKKRTKKWLPVDSYIGGREHAVLHLLYSRFMTMVLKDLGQINFDEPYKRFFGHGLITNDGVKMSKSKGNVVNPDDMIKKYGADTVRLYLRFIGDFSQGGDWRDSGIEGMHKFIVRMWKVFHEIDGSGSGVENISMIDKTIKVVGEDIEKLSFNTAVARIMEYVNWLRNNKDNFNKTQAKKAKEVLAFVIAPMAPHLAEEFWIELKSPSNSPLKKGRADRPLTKGGRRGFSIFEEKWPKFNPKNIIDETFELVIQVNGKVRDKIVASKDITENQATALALESNKVQKYLAGKKPKKVLYVKGRLVSIVISSL